MQTRLKKSKLNHNFIDLVVGDNTARSARGIEGLHLSALLEKMCAGAARCSFYSKPKFRNIEGGLNFRYLPKYGFRLNYAVINAFKLLQKRWMMLTIFGLFNAYRRHISQTLCKADNFTRTV